MADWQQHAPRRRSCPHPLTAAQRIPSVTQGVINVVPTGSESCAGVNGKLLACVPGRFEARVLGSLQGGRNYGGIFLGCS